MNDEPIVSRTGAQHFTITEAHPYHEAVGPTDHKGAGRYRKAHDERCPLCRQEPLDAPAKGVANG